MIFEIMPCWQLFQEPDNGCIYVIVELTGKLIDGFGFESKIGIIGLRTSNTHFEAVYFNRPSKVHVAVL